MKKKILAALAVFALLFSLAGCTLTTPQTVGTIGEVEISAGLYLLHQYNAYQRAGDYTAEKDILKATLTLEDGTQQSGSEYVAAETLRSLEYYAAVETKYRELGGQLSEEELAFATSQAEGMWANYGSVLADNGIGQETVQTYMEGVVRTTQMLDLMYGPQGEQPVSEEEIWAYVDENFRQGQYIALPLMDYTTYMYLDDDTKAQMEKLADQMRDALAQGRELTEVAKEYLPQALPLAGQEYKEEELSNYIADLSYTPSSATAYGEQVVEGVMAAQPGQARVIESGAMLMVYLAQDVRELYTLDEVRDTALVEMKGDELDALYAELGASLPHNLDASAMKTYSPKNIR